MKIHLMGLLHVAVAVGIALIAPDLLGHTLGNALALAYVVAAPLGYLLARVLGQRRKAR